MLTLQTLNQASGHYVMCNYTQSLKGKKDFIPFVDFHINEEVLAICQKTVDAASCVLKDPSSLALSEILCYLVRVAVRGNDHSSDFL